ncbi:alpha/beta-hydrolase [Trichocladium antarcticum]|uniref:Alpha/beta-hydrolase n=1 Tax=Trichocladium antarcticum TaxID=1450529 RepID=A0AAN6UKN6_9PEZI|nr:alpha/beta-hydrolase [Trichocladium antarcticum]
MSPHRTQGVADGQAKGSRNWTMGAEAFERRMPHHNGIRALWETKWKFPCSKSLYPFHDGAFEDFEPIFDHLIKTNINDATSPAYTTAFLPTAARLTARADATTDPAAASALYLRACAVYRIARFPHIVAAAADPAKWAAWEAQKRVYARAGRGWPCPLEEALEEEEEEEEEGGGGMPVYVRVPRARVDGPEKVPVVVLMTGLDGYRPDNTGRCEEFLQRGWASVVVEIPGTADCPADSADPESPDRLWTTLLEWMGEDGRFDMRRVMVWGLSSGGYYAVRIAHTHKDQLIGCVAQGAGCHHFYDPEWLAKADGHEYPFQLSPAMATKHGFDSVDEYKAKAQKKFSLLETGIIHKPSTRLLLVNGTHDGLMPIEDSMMLFEYGTPKEARFFTGALHMGYPLANESVYPWMEEVMASVRD